MCWRSGIRALSLQNAAARTTLFRLEGMSGYTRTNCYTGMMGLLCISTGVLRDQRDRPGQRLRHQRNRPGQRHRPQRMALDQEGSGC